MTTHKITLMVSRTRWNEAAQLVEDRLVHCNLSNLHCREPTGVSPIVANGTILVYTENIDMESAMLVCHRLTSTFCVKLHNDQLPDPNTPITVEPHSHEITETP